MPVVGHRSRRREWLRGSALKVETREARSEACCAEVPDMAARKEELDLSRRRTMRKGGGSSPGNASIGGSPSVRGRMQGFSLKTIPHPVSDL